MSKKIKKKTKPQSKVKTAPKAKAKPRLKRPPVESEECLFTCRLDESLLQGLSRHQDKLQRDTPAVRVTRQAALRHLIQAYSASYAEKRLELPSPCGEVLRSFTCRLQPSDAQVVEACRQRLTLMMDHAATRQDAVRAIIEQTLKRLAR